MKLLFLHCLGTTVELHWYSAAPLRRDTSDDCWRQQEIRTMDCEFCDWFLCVIWKNVWNKPISYPSSESITKNTYSDEMRGSQRSIHGYSVLRHDAVSCSSFEESCCLHSLGPGAQGDYWRKTVGCLGPEDKVAVLSETSANNQHSVMSKKTWFFTVTITSFLALAIISSTPKRMLFWNGLCATWNEKMLRGSHQSLPTDSCLSIRPCLSRFWAHCSVGNVLSPINCKGSEL